MMILLLVLPVILRPPAFCFFFFFNDTATTEIYTLSLHDALPIWVHRVARDGPESEAREKPSSRFREQVHALDLVPVREREGVAGELLAEALATQFGRHRPRAGQRGGAVQPEGSAGGDAARVAGGGGRG